MKLLYIWIEEYRNIAHQGIVVDSEYIISVITPEKVDCTYLTDDGHTIVAQGGAPKLGTKTYSRCIKCEKNNGYRWSPADSIQSIAALVGKNAVGKSSILQCMCEEEISIPWRDNRQYFLAFLDEKQHRIEIRSKGVRISGDNIVCLNQSIRNNYYVYAIPLESASLSEPHFQNNSDTHFFFFSPQRKPTQYLGYNVLGIPTTIGDLDAFNQRNSFGEAYDFLSRFPQFGGTGNKFAIILRANERAFQPEFFTNSEYISDDYKLLFIYRLAQITLSNMRDFLYHHKIEYSMSGKPIDPGLEKTIRTEDAQAARITSFANISYPNDSSGITIRTVIDSPPIEAINKALDFFAESQLPAMGKADFAAYITALRVLFEELCHLDSSYFTAFYKLEIPFDTQYHSFVSSWQELIRNDRNENSSLTSGIEIRFEWLSSGEIHLAMLFSALYQRILDDCGNKKYNNVIFALDEPEMHMHPELGRIFLSELSKAVKEFRDTGAIDSCQFILATHSPFIVQSLGSYNSSLTLVEKHKDEVKTCSFSELPQLVLPGRNDYSFGLIMYKIFEVPTTELHNELYGVLQEQSGCYREIEFEKWLMQKGLCQSKKWIRRLENGTVRNDPATLQTYVRNFIHHPENQLNPAGYTPAELKQSIDEMLHLLYPL